MKNQYFGDVNDYRKYGLLRVLASKGSLRLGICWLLTADDDRTDGEFRQYLHQPGRWRHHDAELYDRLRCLLAPGTERSVVHARNWDLVPGATYFEAFLPDETLARQQYFTAAGEELADCDLIFFDPDNGIEAESATIGARGSCKCIYWCELIHAYKACASRSSCISTTLGSRGKGSCPSLPRGLRKNSALPRSRRFELPMSSSSWLLRIDIAKPCHRCRERSRHIGRDRSIRGHEVMVRQPNHRMRRTVFSGG